MKIQVKESIGITGKTIELSTQELIILADMNTELKSIRSNNAEIEIVEIPHILVEHISVLLSQFTEGVQSMTECHAKLFNVNNINEIESHRTIRYHLIDTETGIEDGSTILSKQQIMERLCLTSQEFEDVVSGNLSLNSWAIKKV